MDTDEWSRLCLFALLVLMSGFLAAEETSFTSLNKFHIKSLADKGDKRASGALTMLDRYDELVTALLIGINILSIAASAIATTFSVRLFGESITNFHLAITTAVVTFVVFIFAETLPKTLAKANNERLALATVGFMRGLCFVLKPFTWTLTGIGRLFSRALPVQEESTVTEDELLDIIDDIQEEGSMDEDKTELVKSALLFDDTTAADILTPRVDMTAIDIDTPMDEVTQIVKDTMHSRIPVFEGTEDNIIGILQIRRFLRRSIAGQKIRSLRDMLDQPLFVHSSTKADDLLNAMNAHKVQMAIVTDEFGGTLGIVTMEDILEELVGDIWDEEDVVIEEIVDQPDGSCRVLGECTLEDFFDHVDFDGYDRDEIGSKTVAAQVMEIINEMPTEGLRFEFYGFRGTIEEVQHNRIVAVTIMPPPKEAAE